MRVQDVAALVAGKNIPAARPVDGFILANISGTCAHGIALANMTNVKLSGIHVTGFEAPLISTENVKGTGLELSAAK